MAIFIDAFSKTLVNEGGYSNNPADPGGETYKGIARNRHPAWQGWPIVDDIKSFCTGDELNARLQESAEVQKSVEDFYKANFWNLLQGDELPNQDVADKVFDVSVNVGPVRAVKWLQESLNLLNRGQGDYPNISVDGNLGPKTLETISTLLKVDGGPSYLIKIFGIFQGMHYVNIMNTAEGLEVFARGWLSRI